MRINQRTLVLMFSFVFCCVTWGTSSAQNPGQGNSKKNLKTTFEEEFTPLQGAIDAEVEKRKGQGKKGPKLDFKCSNPNSNNPKCLKAVECLDCGDVKKPNGKVVGRKRRSETIITYGAPDQRKESMTAFDPVRIGGPKSETVADMGLQDPEDLVKARVRQGAFGIAEAINDDQDCIDSVTREWFGEVQNSLGCFENQMLRATLEESVDRDGCTHVETGEVFLEDRTNNEDGVCYDENGFFKVTSLVQLFDEDGQEDSGPQIDQDGDGIFDEDPAEGNGADDACKSLYQNEGLTFDAGSDWVEEQCDLTRLYMVKFNRKVEKILTDNGKPVELPYRVNAKGKPLTEEQAEQDKYKKAKPYGQNRRKVTVKEKFALKCKGKQELVDDECVSEPGSKPKKAALASARLLADGSAGVAEAFDRTAQSDMLMGFTFAPPVVEWGYAIKEEGCIDLLLDEVCLTLFEARIGFKFDIAAGLRLPIEVDFNELPEQEAPGTIAESSPVITTTVTPKDYSAAEFTDLCERNKLSPDCDRFAFPEFIDSFNPFKTPEEADGSEAVARETVFAGAKLEVLEIPLFTWGIDSDLDLMAACTALNLKENGDLSVLSGLTQNTDKDVYDRLLAELKDEDIICGSFTTPYGNDSSGDQRAFPFTANAIKVRADCNIARLNNETIDIKGKKRPICTGIVLDLKGATLGIGLELKIKAGSQSIEANWDAVGDGRPTGPAPQNLEWTPGNGATIQVTADNYTARTDGGLENSAAIGLDDFKYNLDTLVLELKGAIQFGGLLAPIPDLADFSLFELPVDTGTVISFPQHEGMDPIVQEFFVRNYALSVDGRATVPDPESDNFKTLLVKPGDTGQFGVTVKNLGSVDGDFDNFRAALSTRPDQPGAPYSFIINPNNDFDCTDAVDAQGQRTGGHWVGNPYDNTPDGCYDAQGQVLPGRIELIDEDGKGPEGALFADQDDDGDGVANEDPVDTWVAAFEPNLFIGGVAPDTNSFRVGMLSVIPFQHPLTKPGVYPVQILADSVEAKSNNLAPTDPQNQSRTDAEDVVFFRVDAFYDPLVVAQALAETAKPGVGKSYTIEVANGSNVDDDITVDTTRVDSNQVGCTLTTLGKAAECPYRATPTAIPLAWTSGELPTTTGLLVPLGVASNPLAVNVPGDWAGMEDTTYQVVFTVTSKASKADPETPEASNRVTIEQTVTATMESMTRYIGLELAELIAVLEAANANGIKTAGLKQMSINAVQRTNNRALALILSGNLGGAGKSHAANIKIMGGFTRALAGSGKSLPPELFDDLNARAAAIITDMTKAESNQIPSN